MKRLVHAMVTVGLMSAQAICAQEQTYAQEQTTSANAAPAAATNSATEFAPDQGLRMNFRGVPLEQVLNYLSKAAGYVVHPKVPVSGRVDVWSDNPLSKDEALTLLKHALNDNGFAVIQDGRLLTIVSSYEVKRNEIPVRKFTTLADIPRTTDVATYIIPVRTLNPVALLRNLTPLIGQDMDLQANESANSLLVTDTQINIRRVAELVSTLDSVSSSINALKVYPLKFADSKTLADLVKQLFPSQEARSSGGGNGGGANFAQFGGAAIGFGGGGTGGGGGRNNGGGNNNSGSTPGSRVAAVADEHSNALIVSAPEDLIATIDQLVEKIDQPVEDVTVVKLFKLKNADPSDTADVLASLFPDNSGSGDATTPQMQFGGPGGPFGMVQAASGPSAGSGEHMKKMGKVTAVPDKRSQSLVVSASRDLMDQIEGLIAEMDTGTANQQKVFVYSLKNADGPAMTQMLQELFASSSTSTSSTTSQNDPLATRSQNMLNSQFSTSASMGMTSGSGSTGGGGAGGR